MKLLSIAIPCYNSQDYMENCIESLLVGGEEVEILVIDDGSSDRTAEIADDYARKYPTIVNLISLWVIRIPICYLLGNLFGKKYLLGGIAVSYLFAFLCMLVFVFIHLKMERKRN